VLGLNILIKYSMPPGGRHSNKSFVRPILLYLVIQLFVLPLLATLVGDSGVLILSLARSRANETLEFVRQAGAKLVINLLLSLEITRPPQPSLKKVRAVV
jgi:hypothetical protein